MTEIDSTPETVRRLVELVAENGLTELSVEVDGVSVTVKAIPDAPVAVAGPAAVFTSSPAPSPTIPAPPAPSSPRGPAHSATTIALESPMVGVFYRSPSPDDPPFVNLGDILRVGQPIGLIEAMKVYSEVPAEAAGRVVGLPVESGKLVQQGQPLVYLEPV